MKEPYGAAAQATREALLLVVRIKYHDPAMWLEPLAPKGCWNAAARFIPRLTARRGRAPPFTANPGGAFLVQHQPSVSRMTAGIKPAIPFPWVGVKEVADAARDPPRLDVNLTRRGPPTEAASLI